MILKNLYPAKLFLSKLMDVEPESSFGGGEIVHCSLEDVHSSFNTHWNEETVLFLIVILAQFL